MVFSSHLFMFYFLPLALVVYYALPRRGKHLALTVLSYGFYGWANPLFMVLMLASTAVDYSCGLVISGALPWGRAPIGQLAAGGPRRRRQKIALAVSVCSNLALLGFFKYFNFGLANYNAVAAALGIPGLSLDLAFKVTLPLGISFYTFQSMSYSIDVYCGGARAIRSFIDFACYVSMFPQLVAGPIIRFTEVADQLQRRTHTLEKFTRGAAFVSLGLAKKVLLANPCGKVADLAFGAASVSVIDAWYGAAAYAFQIYFDFSAYSDMAIGMGLMLGFVFPKNFDSPYLAGSITEFWRRWHMSLSSWMRDYLYIPLGGSRKGRARTYANIAVVMLLGGLWHGAAWNFVIWGAMHAALLMAERVAGKRSLYHRLPRPGRIAVTFVILLFTWVFFRADSLPAALAYCGSMLGVTASAESASLLAGVMYQPYYLGTFAIGAVVVWAAPQTWDFTRRLTAPRAGAVLAALAAALVVLATQAYNPFIYFIF